MVTQVVLGTSDYEAKVLILLDWAHNRECQVWPANCVFDPYTISTVHRRKAKVLDFFFGSKIVWL